MKPRKRVVALGLSFFCLGVLGAAQDGFAQSCAPLNFDGNPLVLTTLVDVVSGLVAVPGIGVQQVNNTEPACSIASFQTTSVGSFTAGFPVGLLNVLAGNAAPPGIVVLQEEQDSGLFFSILQVAVNSVPEPGDQVSLLAFDEAAFADFVIPGIALAAYGFGVPLAISLPTTVASVSTDSLVVDQGRVFLFVLPI